jgi:hypothetical protein
MADREKLKEVQCWRPKRQAALVVSLPKGENDRSGSGAPARAYGHAIALLEAENAWLSSSMALGRHRPPSAVQRLRTVGEDVHAEAASGRPHSTTRLRP